MTLNKLILAIPLKLRFQNIGAKCYYSKSVIESAEETPIFIEETKDISRLERKRNKSRLTVGHRNILFDQKPYKNSKAWYHDTVKYKKRTLGRYGMNAVGVPAGFAWPLPDEVEDQVEYERLAHPLNIQERLQKIKEEKKKEEDHLIARQKEISDKMAVMHNLIADVQRKIAEKQEKELEAKRNKERKIEEIRQKLIAQGVSKDKLSQAVAMAEKSEKKIKKELRAAKMIERQQKMLKKLAEEEAERKNLEAEDEDTDKN